MTTRHIVLPTAEGRWDVFVDGTYWSTYNYYLMAQAVAAREVTLREAHEDFCPECRGAREASGALP